MSDVGLISTQEDVIRKPMLNHIAAFSNSVARVYLLVQKTSTDTGWSHFSIVQDLTVTPVLDYYAELTAAGPRFEGTSCYKCHSSGPLAIHPAREDLVLDAPLAAALSQHIAEQPRSQFVFPKDSAAHRREVGAEILYPLPRGRRGPRRAVSGARASHSCAGGLWLHAAESTPEARGNSRTESVVGAQTVACW